jgi:ubiquinone biosynthesis protein UbiJ
MLATAALGFVNHLLDGEAWARARLQPFGGRIIQLACGPVSMRLAITPEGKLQAAGAESEAAVALTLPSDAPLRALNGRNALMADARIEGTADLAECLGFLARHLDWDIEDDLAPLVGDIAARRLVQGGKAFIDWHLKLGQTVTRQLAAYVTQENPVLIGRTELAALTGNISDVKRETEHLEQRLNALAAVTLAPPTAATR